MTTKHATSPMRKVLAGITLAGALSMPYAGVATATGDSGQRAGRGSGVVTSSDNGGGGDRDKGGNRAEGNGRAGGDDNARTTVAGLQAVCQEKIARRLTDLDRLEAKLAEKPDVATPAHAAVITLIVAEARTGLRALGTEIGAATTIDALKPLCARIVTDLRIYALRIPQAGLVLAADALVAKQATFATLRTKLETAIAARATRENAAAVAALLVEFDQHVATMAATAAAVPEPVLALTPADYNADRSVLKPFVAATKDARSEAKLAAKTARKILHLLAGGVEGEDDHGPHDGVAAPTSSPTRPPGR